MHRDILLPNNAPNALKIDRIWNEIESKTKERKSIVSDISSCITENYH
jgi:hypothetical protein